MTVQIGNTAPDFEAQTTQGTIKFHEWLGDSWGVLFSHPKDFTPVCTDGEVESFQLMPVEKVMQIVRHSEEFKPNCNLVIIDFLIRHGLLDSEEADYTELVCNLHRQL